MSQYVITIVPVEDDGDQFTGPVSQTVVRIEAGAGNPVVKELTVQAPEGAGLSGELPYVDFDMLLRAFVEPTTGRRRSAAVASATTIAEPTTTRESGTAEPDERQPAPRNRSTTSHRRTVAGRQSRLRTGRAYRRAPDMDTLESVYEQVGTISGVAAHFNVPVHTAQGWISRMRRRNVEPTNH